MNVLHADGVDWVHQDDVLAQLGADVNPAMLRAWRRTHGLRSHRVGHTVWWDLQAAIECEQLTRESGRGRPRRSVG